MNTEQLRNFAMAYRTRNFAAAARAIPMSAQGFTKSIRTLEAELGVPLFVRDEETGAHMPTSYADELAIFANEQDIRLRDLRRSFRRISAEENSEVLLGASLGIIGFLSDDFIRRFEKQHPGVRLVYMEGNDTYCDQQLSDEVVGLAFTLAPYDRAFETEELYSTPICLWVNANDPLSEKDMIEAADLDGRALALPGPEFKCYENILSRCRAAGVWPETILASSEMFWLYNFAYEGRGLAFSAGHLGELPFFADESVKCIPYEGATWRFGLSSLPKHRLTEAEKEFKAFCQSYFPKRFGGGVA